MIHNQLKDEFTNAKNLRIIIHINYNSVCSLLLTCVLQNYVSLHLNPSTSEATAFENRLFAEVVKIIKGI